MSRCFVLGQGSPYTFIDLYSVERGSGVAAVIDAIRPLVSKRYSRSKGFEINLYQVSPNPLVGSPF